METMGAPDRKPLLAALTGMLLFMALALGPRAQAHEPLMQTVPTPTPKITPPRTTPTLNPPGATETPQPPGATGTAPAPTKTDLPAGEQTTTAGGRPTLRLEVSAQDVLPEDAIEYRVWIGTASPSAVASIVLALDMPALLDVQRIRATHGSAEVIGQSISLYLGTLEGGSNALAIISARVRPEARAGDMILVQAMAYYDGGQARSNVVASGLPPAQLPATGLSRRAP